MELIPAWPLSLGSAVSQGSWEQVSTPVLSSAPQHVVFSIGRVLDLLVPDIPESVEVKVKREYYLAKQALAENEVSPSPSPHASPSLTRGRGVAPSLVLCCSV